MFSSLSLLACLSTDSGAAQTSSASLATRLSIRPFVLSQHSQFDSDDAWSYAIAPFFPSCQPTFFTFSDETSSWFHEKVDKYVASVEPTRELQLGCTGGSRECELEDIVSKHVIDTFDYLRFNEATNLRQAAPSRPQGSLPGNRALV